MRQNGLGAGRPACCRPWLIATTRHPKKGLRIGQGRETAFSQAFPGEHGTQTTSEPREPKTQLNCPLPRGFPERVMHVDHCRVAGGQREAGLWA